MGTTPTADAPLRLSEALALAFPNGGMTVSGLRSEAGRGRLIITEINGRRYTTLRALDNLIRRAREEAEAKLKPRANQCVYVVGFGPYVKIGWTGDHFERRLARLSFPEKLEVYATLSGATRADEKRLHQRFAALRLQGEWFRREGELAAWIESGCQK